jgi:hypothetical protein
MILQLRILKVWSFKVKGLSHVKSIRWMKKSKEKRRNLKLMNRNIRKNVSQINFLA